MQIYMLFNTMVMLCAHLQPLLRKFWKNCIIGPIATSFRQNNAGLIWEVGKTLPDFYFVYPGTMAKRLGGTSKVRLAHSTHTHTHTQPLTHIRFDSGRMDGCVLSWLLHFITKSQYGRSSSGKFVLLVFGVLASKDEESCCIATRTEIVVDCEKLFYYFIVSLSISN